jgi:hypothetical protein
VKKLFFHAVLVLLPFALLEGFFRLLPVSNPPYLLPVTAQDPVVHYQPNIEYLNTVGWNFAIRSRMRTNNYGYNNIVDYRPDASTPLLMVLGDSFVEAQAVGTGKSAAELLNAAVSPEGRVYSIGISGAALSQYLAFAEFAKDKFHPRAMAFVVIENDYDESLLKYAGDPRFHYFDDSGVLHRVDYHRSAIKTLLRHSAFARYVVLNVNPQRIGFNLSRLLCGSGDPYACNGPAALEQRIADSKRAVGYFFSVLPAKTGLGTDAILFVMDAQRPDMYQPDGLHRAAHTYVARMRQYFIEQARSRGYEVLDMQPTFIARHRLDGARFEFATDSHWNALANAVVAEEIRKSGVFVRTFGQPAPGAH